MEKIPNSDNWNIEKEKTFVDLIMRVKALGHSEPKGFEKVKVEGGSNSVFAETLEFSCEYCQMDGSASRSERIEGDQKWLAEGDVFTTKCSDPVFRERLEDGF